MDYDCGQVVSVFAFYSDDPSLNPTEVYSFHSVKLFENNEHKQKEAGDGLCKTIGKQKTAKEVQNVHEITKSKKRVDVYSQCDQIGQFVGLWATF